MLNGDELKRVLVIFILFVFSILFWMTYEQAGSSLTLFADRLTQTTIFRLGISVELVPVSSCDFRDHLRADYRRGLAETRLTGNPPVPGKFTIGLFFAGIAFVVIAFASTLAGRRTR